MGVDRLSFELHNRGIKIKNDPISTALERIDVLSDQLSGAIQELSITKAKYKEAADRAKEAILVCASIVTKLES